MATRTKVKITLKFIFVQRSDETDEELWSTSGFYTVSEVVSKALFLFKRGIGMICFFKGIVLLFWCVKRFN